MYKSLLRPIWAYAIQIGSYANPCQIRIIQAFQSITLRMISSAPWYVSNLHSDFKTESELSILSLNAIKTFYSKLQTH